MPVAGPSAGGFDREFDLSAAARIGVEHRRAEYVTRVGVLLFITAVGVFAVGDGAITGGTLGLGFIALGVLVTWSSGTAAWWQYRATWHPPIRLTTSPDQLTFYRTDGSSASIQWRHFEEACTLSSSPPDVTEGQAATFEILPEGGSGLYLGRFILRGPVIPVTFLTTEAHEGIVRAAAAAGFTLHTAGVL